MHTFLAVKRHTEIDEVIKQLGLENDAIKIQTFQTLVFEVEHQNDLNLLVVSYDFNGKNANELISFLTSHLSYQTIFIIRSSVREELAHRMVNYLNRFDIPSIYVVKNPYSSDFESITLKEIEELKKKILQLSRPTTFSDSNKELLQDEEVLFDLTPSSSNQILQDGENEFSNKRLFPPSDLSFVQGNVGFDGGLQTPLIEGDYMFFKKRATISSEKSEKVISLQENKEIENLVSLDVLNQHRLQHHLSLDTKENLSKKIRKNKTKKIFILKRWRPNIPVWTGMGLILLGFSFVGKGVKPLIEFKQNQNETLQEWKQLKENHTKQIEEGGTVDEETLNSNVYGLITLGQEGKQIGIRLGIDDETLKKGAGLDPETVIPGKTGNAVIFAHREEFFWGLQELKIGELIKIETLSHELSFEIVNIFITDPIKNNIYLDYGEEKMISLVTCYPFVYMGSTPQRYVVVAKLVNEISTTTPME